MYSLSIAMSSCGTPHCVGWSIPNTRLHSHRTSPLAAYDHIYAYWRVWIGAHDWKRSQENTMASRSALESAPIRIAVCAARRRLRRQPRKRPRRRRQPRRPCRSTGSQRRSRARTSVRTCLRARPRGLQRRVHLASRSSRMTTSTVRSNGWRTRVLTRAAALSKGLTALPTPPCSGSVFGCLFVCLADSRPLLRFGFRVFVCLSVCLFVCLFWLDAFPLCRLAWRAELVSSLKLPKFPARDLKRALVQAASVRALTGPPREYCKRRTAKTCTVAQGTHGRVSQRTAEQRRIGLRRTRAVPRSSTTQ
jgi:hypothetical protein